MVPPSIASIKSAIDGKSFVLLTDLTEEEGLSPAGSMTIRLLIKQNAQAIIIVPCRLNVHLGEGKFNNSKLVAALLSALPDVETDDLAKIVICTAEDVNERVVQGIFEYGFFINDSYSNHPTALSLRHLFNACERHTLSAQSDSPSKVPIEMRGFAFSACHNEIWPLNKKNVLVVTDAASESERRLTVNTVQSLVSLEKNKAKSVHVVVICNDDEGDNNNKASAAVEIATLLKTTLGDSLPTSANSPLWNESISVSSGATTKQMHRLVQSGSAHIFVNDTKSVKTSLFEIENVIENQACGLLRQCSMVVGSASTTGSGASTLDDIRGKLHGGQRSLKEVYPIRYKRFVFMVDSSAMHSFVATKQQHEEGEGEESDLVNKSASAILTHSAIADIVAAQGIVILIDSQQTKAHSVKEFIAESYFKFIQVWNPVKSTKKNKKESAAAADNNSLTGVIEKKQLAPGSILFVPTLDDESSEKREEIINTIIDSCDVFVRDMTVFGGQISQEADNLLKTARRQLGHVAIGNAASALNVDLTPSTPIILDGLEKHLRSSLAHLAQQNSSTFMSAEDSATTYSPLDVNATTSTTSTTASAIRSSRYASESAATKEAEMQEMRKPIDGGEGSLISNVVASLATCALLHPLQLYIYRAPALPATPTSPASLNHLGMRCLHSLVRDLAFYIMSKKVKIPGVCANALGSHNGCVPGFLAASVSGIVSDPIRCMSFGGNKQDVIASLSDTTTVATTAVMNLAPQLSFRLGTVAQRYLRQFFPFKMQISLLLRALSRAIVAAVLYRFVVVRRSYGTNSSLGSVALRSDGGKMAMIAYIVKEILTLFIETFVQRYFH